MKTLLLSVVSLLGSVHMLSAQAVDYNKIILPEGAENVSFEERLVQLAWQNNPTGRIADHGVDQAIQEGKVASNAWTSLMGVTGNLNEFSIKQFKHESTTTTNGTTNNPSIFYPRYNIFVNIPMSLFFQNPHIRKAARAKTEIAVEQVKLTKLALRTRVLKLYTEYKKMELIYLIKKQSSLDDESNYSLVEKKFKNGEILVDEYMKSQRNRNNLRIELAVAESDFRQSKLDIEEIIGMRMEDAK